MRKWARIAGVYHGADGLALVKAGTPKAGRGPAKSGSEWDQGLVTGQRMGQARGRVRPVQEGSEQGNRPRQCDPGAGMSLCGCVYRR